MRGMEQGVIMVICSIKLVDKSLRCCSQRTGCCCCQDGGHLGTKPFVMVWSYGLLHLKVCSASMAAFRILSVI